MELTEAGCSFDLLVSATRVVRDEARHVELCRRMVVALGGTSALEGTPSWTRSQQSVPVRTRLLRTVVGSLCVGEMLSAAMISRARDFATDPLAHAVTASLARDEAFHGRLGWDLLEIFTPHLSVPERQELE